MSAFHAMRLKEAYSVFRRLGALIFLLWPLLSTAQLADPAKTGGLVVSVNAPSTFSPNNSNPSYEFTISLRNDGQSLTDVDLSVSSRMTTGAVNIPYPQQPFPEGWNCHLDPSRSLCQSQRMLPLSTATFKFRQITFGDWCGKKVEIEAITRSRRKLQTATATKATATTTLVAGGDYFVTVATDKSRVNVGEQFAAVIEVKHGGTLYSSPGYWWAVTARPPRGAEVVDLPDTCRMTDRITCSLSKMAPDPSSARLVFKAKEPGTSYTQFKLLGSTVGAVSSYTHYTQFTSDVHPVAACADANPATNAAGMNVIIEQLQKRRAAK